MSFKSSLLYASKILFSSDKDKSQRGRKSLIGAMICIGISLIPLIAILCVSNGMIEGITERMIKLSSYDLEVKLNSSSLETSSYESFLTTANLFKTNSELTGIYPEVRFSCLSAGKKNRSGASVRAVPFDIFEENKSFSDLFTVIEGEKTFHGNKNAVIGEKLSQILNLSVGDKISLITAKSFTNGKVIPKVSTYTVSGIISSGYQELDALWVFIPLESYFTSFKNTYSEFIIGFTTDKTFSPELVKLEKDLNRFININLGLTTAYVDRWDEINASQYENFSSTKILILLIVLLILLVASINISSALVMIVMERRKEIAILKSCGATSKGISLSFLTVGFVCGLGGIIIGLPLGLIISLNVNPLISAMEKILNFFGKVFWFIFHHSQSSFSSIHILNPEYYLQDIPVTIPIGQIIGICIGTLFLSLLFSLLPSIRAGKEKPVSTLRKI